MITIGNDLTIFNAWGEPKVRLDIPNDFKQANELMSEHYVQFTFPLTIKYDFVRADYIDYKGIRYAIRTDCQPTESGFQNYKYEPKFEAPEMFWQDFICWYIYQGLKEAEWTLMEHAGTFLQIGCDNINAYTGETWTVGVVEPTDMQNLTFSSQNVFDFLTDVAEAFNCEWYLDYEAKTINLVYSYSKGELMELRREIELIDITRSNENSDEYCTRMYAFGGTRNIPSNYRSTGSSEVVDAIVQKRLRLPISNGDYIDAFPNMTGNKIIEKVFTFDYIYPKRTGTITALRTATVKNDDGIEMTVFYFKDSGLNFNSEYILPGLTLSLQFGENSFLSGRDFELAFHNTEEHGQEFEIINNQDNPDLIIPNDLLCPRVGDFYVLYNFNISLVGDQYVGEAEQELLTEAQAKMASLQEENATYTCMANPFRVAAYGLDMGLGQSVKLKSLIFNGGEKVSRIRGFTKYPVSCKDEYLVGEKPRYSRRKALEAKVDSNKKEADVNYLEAMRASNNNTRSIRGMNYLRTALQNETTIDGGLILTTLIQMGLMQGDVWVNTAGVNGVKQNDDDIAFWGGGTLQQAINLVENPEATDDVAGFAVTHGGRVIMGQAVMRGKVTSSDTNGNKIVFDAENKSIEMFARFRGSSISIAKLEWINSTDSTNDIISTKLTLGDMYTDKVSGVINGDLMSQCVITPKGITFKPLLGDPTLIINSEIPTSSDFEPIGTVWSNNGNLEIVE
ncbi:hypothetical protein [Dysgonomonas mossii]|uniref:Prophage tail endopeptidase domain-containing protein n=1 Tax=Dysgonomonas mossii DSM 22836 TaxID=742767 RepID=F8X501_9BACT|nr:hypothetical protein [Dysgonomonas mossii]EGK04699.1 hypothetical protein HMPREF9456_03310 [Dysgonomonas mossii DSM 22836]